MKRSSHHAPASLLAACRATAALCLGSAGALAALLGGCAATPGTPLAHDVTLPAELHTGPRQTLDQVLVTTGDETWRCGTEPADAQRGDAPAAAVPTSTSAGSAPSLHWIQIGSAGTLVDRDRRQNVGTVRPGGYFVAADGSYVRAQLERQSQVGANTLTWALYRIDRDVTAGGHGRFAQITSIQRIDTIGGLPIDPACSREGLRMLVPYTATYLLYRTGTDPHTTAARTQPVSTTQAPAVYGTAQVPATSSQRVAGR